MGMKAWRNITENENPKAWAAVLIRSIVAFAQHLNHLRANLHG
jgi:hypothetical protein